jgi:hypothetical protein
MEKCFVIEVWKFIVFSIADFLTQFNPKAVGEFPKFSQVL